MASSTPYPIFDLPMTRHPSMPGCFCGARRRCQFVSQQDRGPRLDRGVPQPRRPRAASVNDFVVEVVSHVEVGNVERPDGVDGLQEGFIHLGFTLCVLELLAQSPQLSEHARSIEPLSLTMIAKRHAPS
jgi:hypothetical protein